MNKQDFLSALRKGLQGLPKEDAEERTGSVTGTILTEKVFLAKSGTGRVSVPQTVSGGICEIVTGTGGIEIGLP